METIVFLGSNKSGTSRDALKVAKSMGYEVILFTDRKKLMTQKNEFPEVDKMIFQEHMEQAMTEMKSFVKEGKQIKACISFIDPFISLAGRIQAELGLFPISVEALSLLEDKALVRHTLKNLQSAPFFSVYDGLEALTVDKPLILKSPASNGSKDVILVENDEEFRKQSKSFHPPILIEEYLEGPQYLIEVAVYQGETHILAMIEQEISKRERFIITGYQFPALLEKEIEHALIQEIKAIVKVIGLQNGSCHLEMRLVADAWKLIEINPRMSGGAMNRIILEGTGMNAAKEIIRMNMGDEPDFQKQFIQPVYAKFLTINKRGRLMKVTGRNRASRCAGVKEVYVKPKRGTILTKPLSLGNRYAYVLAAGPSPEEARSNALQAAKEIRFVLEAI